jgi:hypothetical protein
MKLLILAGMVVIFISVIFILFVMAEISEGYLNCSRNEADRIVCDLREVGLPFVIGLTLIGLFVLVDAFVVHFLLEALKNQTALALGL